MALHATQTLQLLLENILQLFQSETAHCQCSYPVTGGHLQSVQQSGQKQVVSQEASGHCSWSTPQEGQT